VAETNKIMKQSFVLITARHRGCSEMPQKKTLTLD